MTIQLPHLCNKIIYITTMVYIYCRTKNKTLSAVIKTVKMKYYLYILILGENLLFSVVYDCSSCLCLHWLLGCPISSAPVWWLATFFPLSYLFLFRHTPQNEQLCEYDIYFINLHPTNFTMYVSLCYLSKLSYFENGINFHGNFKPAFLYTYIFFSAL